MYHIIFLGIIGRELVVGRSAGVKQSSIGAWVKGTMGMMGNLAWGGRRLHPDSDGGT